MPQIVLNKDQLGQVKEVPSRLQENQEEENDSRIHVNGDVMVTTMYGYPDRFAGFIFGRVGLRIDLSQNWQLGGSLSLLAFRQDNMLAPQQTYSLAYVLGGSGMGLAVPFGMQMSLNYLFRRREPDELEDITEGRLQIIGGLISQSPDDASVALSSNRNYVDGSVPTVSGSIVAGVGINAQIPFLSRRLILNSQATIGAATYVNYLNSESSSFQVTDGMFGYYFGLTGIIHPESDLNVTMGFGGHEMLNEESRDRSDMNLIAALHVHFWRLDLDVAYRWARIERPTQPRTATRHSFALSLALPWQINEQVSLTPFITGFYLNESGRLYYGGQPTADGGCSSLMCGEDLHLNLGETIGGANLGLRLGIRNFFLQLDGYIGSNDIGGIRLSGGANWR